MLRIENLCRLVGFDEGQVATLVKGKPLEDFIRRNMDGTRLLLAIDRKPVAGWFKEQFEKLRQNIRRPIQPQRKGKGFKF